MFVCGGENIDPGEVERMLERHPGIQQAAVVPVADDVRGQKPVAFVVAAPGVTVTPAMVKEFALAHGPALCAPASRGAGHRAAARRHGQGRPPAADRARGGPRRRSAAAEKGESR